MTKMSSKLKYHIFVTEPITDKPVTALPGVDKALGRRLKAAGYDQAYVVMGQFLVLKKDRPLFEEWMKQTCKANAKQSADCAKCLEEWCNQFL